MIRFSEGRISALAHKILALFKDPAVAEVEQERYVLAEIKRAFAHHQEEEDRIDEAVRRKIASLSRHVPPGSREWDVLYQRYAEEERRRRRKP